MRPPMAGERTLLVTGGAGFIGSRFVAHHLRARPRDRIVVLDALTYAASLENLTGMIDASERVQFVHGSVRSPHIVESVLAGRHAREPERPACVRTHAQDLPLHQRSEWSGRRLERDAECRQGWRPIAGTVKYGPASHRLARLDRDADLERLASREKIGGAPQQRRLAGRARHVRRGNHGNGVRAGGQ